MRAFGLHAGIGSASRKITLEKNEYTIGVLVNTNHSQLNDLNPLLQDALESHWKKSLKQVQDLDHFDRAKQAESQRQGSIIIIIATDLPLNQLALQKVAEHAALGIAQTGGIMTTTSGDFALAFSTANPVLMNEQATKVYRIDTVHPQALTPVFQATIEAVVEAQVNALVASHSNL
jgi:D-aminopeptidase